MPHQAQGKTPFDPRRDQLEFPLQGEAIRDSPQEASEEKKGEEMDRMHTEESNGSSKRADENG